MSVSILMGGGMLSPDEEEKPSDDEASGDDDEDLADLGAKYAQRLGEALEAKDWPEVFKAFGRMKELCEYADAQERGY